MTLEPIKSKLDWQTWQVAYFFFSPLNLRVRRLFIFSTLNCSFTATQWSPYKTWTKWALTMRAIFFFFEGEWKTGMGKQTFFYEVADEIITKQGADEALILVCTQMYKTWTMHWIWRASQKQRRTSCPLNTPQSCCTHLACSVSFRDAVPTRQKGTQPFRVSSVELHGIHFHVVLSEKKQKLYPNPPSQGLWWC